MTNQRISIRARILEETRGVLLGQAKSHRVAFADGRIDDRRILYVVVYIQMIDAVFLNLGHQCILVRRIHVVIRNGEELLVVRLKVPNMRERPVHRSTDSDCIAEDMRCMNREVHYYRTVATVRIRHREWIFACFEEF